MSLLRLSNWSEVALRSLYGEDQRQIGAMASFVPELSPPPFLASFAEVGVDLRTGKLEMVDYVAAANFFADKEWIGVGPDGTVHVTWTRFYLGPQGLGYQRYGIEGSGGSGSSRAVATRRSMA